MRSDKTDIIVLKSQRQRDAHVKIKQCNITALLGLIPQLLCFDVIENSPLKTLDLIFFFSV